MQFVLRFDEEWCVRIKIIIEVIWKNMLRQSTWLMMDMFVIPVKEFTRPMLHFVFIPTDVKVLIKIFDIEENHIAPSSMCEYCNKVCPSRHALRMHLKRANNAYPSSSKWPTKPQSIAHLPEKRTKVLLVIVYIFTSLVLVVQLISS